MWISEFWCGVIATIAVEFIVLVAYAISIDIKHKNKNK